MNIEHFDADAAFAFLDSLATRFGPSQAALIEPAWEATWIVCMTDNPRHEVTARIALALVIAEIHRLASIAYPGQCTPGSDVLVRR